jgi:hypothetical protein
MGYSSSLSLAIWSREEMVHDDLTPLDSDPKDNDAIKAAFQFLNLSFFHLCSLSSLGQSITVRIVLISYPPLYILPF